METFSYDFNHGFDREIVRCSMMKKKFISTCKTLFLAMAASAALAFPGWAAAIQGGITNVDSNSISGWAWNKDDTNDVQKVEVHICQSGNPNPVKYLHVDADDYREDLVSKLKDGWHGFSVPIDWSQLSGSDFKVKAYAVKGDKYYTLGDIVSYNKSGKSSQAPAKTSNASADNTVTMVEPLNGSSGSGTTPKAAPAGSQKERSLGMFTISGYCGCSECGSGIGLTYSGTVPQANHTIAADLSVLPLGTRVRIGNTVYTVEDKGSSIVGNMIDIFYNNHETAMLHGVQQQEVFLIQ